MNVRGAEILWNWPALHTFYRLHPHTAMIVDRAVIRFVEHGEGQVEHRPPYVRLRAGFYDVVLIVDRNERYARDRVALVPRTVAPPSGSRGGNTRPPSARIKGKKDGHAASRAR